MRERARKMERETDRQTDRQTDIERRGGGGREGRKCISVDDFFILTLKCGKPDNCL